MNGIVAAKVITAEPWPAEGYFAVNNWTVQLLTPKGAPFPEATVSSVDTFDRMHGIANGRTLPEIAKQAEPATYRLEDLTFLLFAKWQVLISVTSPSGKDSISFPVCVLRNAPEPPPAKDAG